MVCRECWQLLTGVSRVVKLLSRLDPTQDNKASLRQVAEEGHRLRAALYDQQQLDARYVDTSTEAQRCFQTIQHAAISIYLSGLYDYHESYWQRYGIAVPTLDRAEINGLVETILAHVVRSLNLSELNSIAFVFALRVAGARSHTAEDRARVMSLLKRIQRCYVVADALLKDLSEHWSQKELLRTIDADTSPQAPP
jgi:hypothetical protein